MATKFVYKSYRKEVNQDIKRRKTRMLTAIGLYLTGIMKLLVPVDTGRLKSSLTYDVNGDELNFGASASEGSGAKDVFYFTLIELGTRYSKAQPFVRPALFDNVENVSKLANREFNR